MPAPVPLGLSASEPVPRWQKESYARLLAKSNRGFTRATRKKPQVRRPLLAVSTLVHDLDARSVTLATS